jgi:cytochrome P450
VNTWSTSSIEQHGHKRQVLNYAFSEGALRGAERSIHQNVDRWLALLRQQKNPGEELTRPMDMEHQVTFLVFDTPGDLAFRECFDMKEPESNL